MVCLKGCVNVIILRIYRFDHNLNVIQLVLNRMKMFGIDHKHTSKIIWENYTFRFGKYKKMIMNFVKIEHWEPCFLY